MLKVHSELLLYMQPLGLQHCPSSFREKYKGACGDRYGRKGEFLVVFREVFGYKMQVKITGIFD